MALIALASVLICFMAEPLQINYYQNSVDSEAWRWDGEQAALLYSVSRYMSDHQVEITSPKLNTDGPQPYKRLTFRILEDGKELYSFKAHPGTVFVRRGDSLYIADFVPGATGCSIIAYDFKANKELWKTRLQSVSHWPHSAYHNAVAIEDRGDALKIRGKESLLHYVEYVDMKTGKTLAQREYPWKEN